MYTWSFYIIPVQQKIHKRWIYNAEIINCKKEDEGLLFIILEFYASVVSCFGIKKITKKYDFLLILYLFRDNKSFKSEKGNNIKLPRTGFLYKQKKINTCTAKLLQIHS